MMQTSMSDDKRIFQYLERWKQGWNCLLWQSISLPTLWRLRLSNICEKKKNVKLWRRMECGCTRSTNCLRWVNTLKCLSESCSVAPGYLRQRLASGWSRAKARGSLHWKCTKRRVLQNWISFFSFVWSIFHCPETSTALEFRSGQFYFFCPC